MFDSSDSRLSVVARAGALVVSVSLGLLVVVNAQFGCDSSSSSQSPPTDPAPASKAVEPAATVEPAPAEAAVEVEVEVDPVQPAAAVESAEPAGNTDNTGSGNAAAPVLMPASKSGGDFGAMRFPGQGAIETVEVEPAANPAPNPAPAQAQQANHD